MSATATIEEAIRNFLKEELMKEEAAAAGATDPLELDSLDQTELRMFLEEEFDVSLEGLTSPLATLEEMVKFVQGQKAE